MNELVVEYKLIASLLMIVVALLVRWLVVRYLLKMPADEQELPKRWINSVKNASNFIIAIGLIVIWLSELRFVALSIATFVVALVIATREFIQCVLGSIYQTSTRMFAIGDWIKVGPNYGEVVRSDWLSTTLLEIDIESKSYGYTGRSLLIPNNQFVVANFQNLNFMRRYVSHSFSIIRDADAINVFQFREMILEKVKEYCSPFEEVAQRYNVLIEKRLGITLAGPAASVRIITTNLGKNEFAVTLFCPTQEAVGIEQRLIEDFMGAWYRELSRLEQEKVDKSSILVEQIGPTTLNVKEVRA